MPFLIYIVGAVILLAGLTSGAVALLAPAEWIAAEACVTLGLLVLTAVKVTRQTDSTE